MSNDITTIQNVRSLLTDNLPDDYILSSAYEIENAMLVLEHIDSRLTWFSELKKARNADLDKEVHLLSDRQNRLRSIILRTMKELEPDKKTLHFPSTGKVSRREGADSWAITDEAAFLDFVEKRGYKKSVVKVKEVIDTREAKKLITELSKTETVPGVTKQGSTESVSITFDKKPDAVLPRQTASLKPDIEKLSEIDI